MTIHQAIALTLWENGFFILQITGSFLWNNLETSGGDICLDRKLKVSGFHSPKQGSWRLSLLVIRSLMFALIRAGPDRRRDQVPPGLGSFLKVSVTTF